MRIVGGKRRMWRYGVVLFAVLSALCGAIAASAAKLDIQYQCIAGGMSHTVAVDKNNQVYVWGSNDAMQLGLGTQVDVSEKPEKLEGLNAVMVSAGYDFSAALTADGDIYLWGYGQIDKPQHVDGIGDIVSIAAGQSSILALQSDGSVWQWEFGAQPEQLTALTRIVSIACGTGHSLALGADGYVYAWGSNTYGQLGSGKDQPLAIPMRVDGLFDVVSIAAGANHSLAVSYSGIVYSWGSNSYGQLGQEKTMQEFQPMPVAGLKNVDSVSAGGDTSLALSGGRVYAWGYGEYGQMGLGESKITNKVPTLLSSPFNGDVAGIACGYYHCMAVTERGALYTWGRNRSFQVGDGSGSNVTKAKNIKSGFAVEDADYAPAILIVGISRWAEEEALSLESREILPPLSWGEFQEGCTRARFIHMLVSCYESIQSSSVHESTTKDFSDLEGHQLESSIRKGITLGLIEGTSSSTISPDAVLTRQEAAKILCGFLTKAEQVTVSKGNTDLSRLSDGDDVSVWAIPYVNFVFSKGIMAGDNNGAFQPAQALTQEQCIVILARLAEQYRWS